MRTVGGYLHLLMVFVPQEAGGTGGGAPLFVLHSMITLCATRSLLLRLCFRLSIGACCPLCSSPLARLPPQLQAGASVAVLARSRAKFDELVPVLAEKELPVDKTHFISIDLSSTDDIRRAAVEANEWAGGCADILVNNGEFRFNLGQNNQMVEGLWLGLCAKLRHQECYRGQHIKPRRGESNVFRCRVFLQIASEVNVWKEPSLGKLVSLHTPMPGLIERASPPRLIRFCSWCGHNRSHRRGDC